MNFLHRLGLPVAMIAGLLMQAPHVSATTLETVVYEGFDYPNGTALNPAQNGGVEANGGSGWTGAWGFAQAGDSPLAVTSTGLSYTGLTTTGGAAQYRGNRAINGSGRQLARISAGVIYVRFLVNLSGGFNNGAPTLRLYDSTLANYTLLVGSNNTGNNASIITTEGTPSVANSGVSINDNRTHLLLVRIDYSTSTVNLWVDPNLAAFDYASPPTANATLSNYAPTFDRIDIFNRQGSYDEITVLRVTSSSTSGSTTAETDVRRTLVLSDRGGRCGLSNDVSGANGTWIQLPSSDQCGSPEQLLLGWSTSPQFPQDVAREQIRKGWGAIDGEFDGTRMIFIPAGGFTLLSNDNTLYPVWG